MVQRCEVGYVCVCVCACDYTLSMMLSSPWQYMGSEVWAPWKLPIGPHSGRTSCAHMHALFLLDHCAGILLFVEMLRIQAMKLRKKLKVDQKLNTS